MKKIGLGILITLTILTLSGGATANAYISGRISTKFEPPGVSFFIPPRANPPFLDIESSTLEKVVFIHYANGRIKAKAKAPTCYKLLNAKWNLLPINYVIHPDVEQTVPGAITTSTETWDAATSRELFANYTIDPLANWDSDTPDGRNEYSFGDYPQDEVIAVTVIWSGISFSRKNRQIIEYDVMFDTDWTWGDAANPNTPNAMDLQNIATHETGHGLGLADVYNSACSAVTMYGYSDYGETEKRSLETADVMGLQKLYGA